MIAEVRTWRITCDRCKKEEIVLKQYSPSLPKGWKRVLVDCIGYREEWDDLCEDCLNATC